ncbi:hypothetical protein FACS1894132_14200 [Clostridia bacterium]|nr:hypothetical protein FACS1894132_14200 [Clostridia bacterium]
MSMMREYETLPDGMTDENEIIKFCISQMKSDISIDDKEVDLSQMANSCILTVSEGQALCKKAIELANDKTIVMSAYELLALSYDKKHKKEALRCVENVISEVSKHSHYIKHPRLSFANNVKGILEEDETFKQWSNDIALTRYENNSGLLNLINCCVSFARSLYKEERIEDAIQLYEEAKTLYSQSDEINFFDLKELLENLAVCYEKKGTIDKANFYKAEAKKYSSLSIATGTATQTNIIEDLETFLQSETMRIFHSYRNYTLHDLADEETFQKFEVHFIAFVEDIISTLESSNEEFRDFDTCHKMLLSILSGERRAIGAFIDTTRSRYLYSKAISYRDGINGKEKDMCKSFELLQRAYEMGCTDATTEIGLLYSVDPIREVILDGVPDYRSVDELQEQNIPLAKLYWKEEALEGDGRAMFLMGQHFYDINSYSNAEFWLDLASEHEFVYADYLLGELYSDSENKRFFDYDEAVARYSKVANCADERYSSLAESANKTLERLSSRFMMYNIQRAGGFGNYYKPYFDDIQSAIENVDNSNDD